MKERFIENGIEYIRCGDYYIPNFDPPKRVHYGKYGMMHEDYIKEHRKIFYNRMILSGKLWDYLAEVDTKARNMVEAIISKSVIKQNITEELKAQDPIKWVGLMNNLKAQAEEFVLSEYVYK